MWRLITKATFKVSDLIRNVDVIDNKTLIRLLFQSSRHRDEKVFEVRL